MAIQVSPIGDKTDLVKAIREVLQDLEDQLNQRAQIYVSTDGRIPAGLNRNDIMLVVFKKQVKLLIKNKTGFDSLTAKALGGLDAGGTNFVGYKEGAAAASVNEFPESNDWGFYNRTAGSPGLYLCYNLNGTIKQTALA